MATRSRRSYRAGAIKGWITRRLREEQEQRTHGQKAREKSESRLTPAQKRQRTIDANRIERELRLARRREADRKRRARAKPSSDGPRRRDTGSTVSVRADRSGRRTGGVLRSLDQLDRDYGDPEDYDYEESEIETSPDYKKKGK